ncbi:FAD-binding domain-containing protein [Aestuariicoccus sp. MJ-SS9]|uniref:FAD-binding domain-containing protein n=1 Tax=Aestuariicoccus sp. MJ-SS9 TaxID=3079855 RepID=UPI0029062EEB|nr:FAD-binding domain-containing protein [Aestuariicoccus sp. MJ-SS9]MDU8911123.1 FAD-binding domain-containing protein [Aestuariicoccus sp. MJ-SS9]
MNTLLWFKRDLRLADHPALHLAQEIGRPVPVYILEPELWRQDDASGRQFAFLRESVLTLREALRARGSDLVIRLGDAVEALERLRQETGARHLVSHEETGNGWTYARDRRVADWARAQGVDWAELPQSGVVRRLKSRDRWAAARNRFMAGDMLPAPVALPPVTLSSDPLPDAAALSLAEDCPQRQPGGRGHAEALLASFLETRGRDYRHAMSSPLAGAAACSRLSPHLAFGTLSVREAVQATAARQRDVRGRRDGWADSLKSLQSRLAWRDHFMQKLEDEPALERRCLHSAYEGLRPREPDAARLEAWRKGETGLPFVDACMRSLIATGWLNFRMRSMLMSVASYHLWLDWPATGAHLARMFTDYEPGIHWSQCQMQSGTTGINTLRIYNPVKQGRDQDPEGAFTRRWLPELAEVPDTFLQEPWRWEGAARLRYPAPVVDVAEAARAARQAVWAVRADPSFRYEAARVVEKHASRKDPQRHFVNDRAPRRRKPRPGDDAQLTLDL